MAEKLLFDMGQFAAVTNEVSASIWKIAWVLDAAVERGMAGCSKEDAEGLKQLMASIPTDVQHELGLIEWQEGAVSAMKDAGWSGPAIVGMGLLPVMLATFKQVSSMFVDFGLMEIAREIAEEGEDPDVEAAVSDVLARAAGTDLN